MSATAAEGNPEGSAEHVEVDSDVDDSHPETSNGLGDDGKRALDDERRLRAKADRARNRVEREIGELKAKLAEYEQKSQSDNEGDVQKLVREAEQRVRAELTQANRSRLVRANVMALASGKLTDPEDAARYLDLDEFDVNEKGEVDSTAVAAAITELISERPYLAPSVKKFVDIDQGVRDAEIDVEAGLSRMTHAYAQNAAKRR